MNKTLKSMIVLKFGTQDDFAARIGMSRSFVSNVVQNRRKLSFQQRIQWAVVLGCSVMEIFPDTRPPSLENLIIEKHNEIHSK
jgi:transcriptional regulator with XRE-family HTH domain